MVEDLATVDPYRVDPAQHRGRDVGILARAFLLAHRRPAHDHRGPAPLPRGGDEEYDW